jgi:Uma2 family endonuclease
MPPRDERGFFVGAPDLAIEVLSPEDRRAEIGAKVEEYLIHGVATVVVVDPIARAVAVHRPAAERLDLRESTQILNLDDVLPGFRCTLADVFD